jgi:hypothetical protein
MRFRRGAPLDRGQVTDVRGRRMGGGLALGGGGMGVVGLVIYLLVSFLSGEAGSASSALSKTNGSGKATLRGRSRRIAGRVRMRTRARTVGSSPS